MQAYRDGGLGSQPFISLRWHLQASARSDSGEGCTIEPILSKSTCTWVMWWTISTHTHTAVCGPAGVIAMMTIAWRFCGACVTYMVLHSASQTAYAHHSTDAHQHVKLDCSPPLISYVREGSVQCIRTRSRTDQMCKSTRAAQKSWFACAGLRSHFHSHFILNSPRRCRNHLSMGLF